MKKKTKTPKVQDKARQVASAIFEHAGAFLMRAVCDDIAAVLRATADTIDALDGELSNVNWQLTQAEGLIGQLESHIDDLERRLASLEPPPPLEAPDSVTGGQGFD